MNKETESKDRMKESFTEKNKDVKIKRNNYSYSNVKAPAVFLNKGLPLLIRPFPKASSLSALANKND